MYNFFEIMELILTLIISFKFIYFIYSFVILSVSNFCVFFSKKSAINEKKNLIKDILIDFFRKNLHKK